jgi:hypothetical protein
MAEKIIKLNWQGKTLSVHDPTINVNVATTNIVVGIATASPIYNVDPVSVKVNTDGYGLSTLADLTTVRYSVLTESMLMSEVKGYTFGKNPVKETGLFTDSPRLALTKSAVSDIPVFSDIPSIVTIYNRTASETSIITDLPVLSTLKDVIETTGFSEIYLHVVNFLRTYTDTATIIDTPSLNNSTMYSDSSIATDQPTQSFGKVNVDSSIIADTPSIALSDVMTPDAIVVSEIAALANSKLSTDGFASTDTTAITVQPVIPDISNFIDTPAIQGSFIQAESYSVTEIASLTPNKSIPSEPSIFTDSVPLLTNAKVILEPLTITDDVLGGATIGDDEYIEFRKVSEEYANFGDNDFSRQVDYHTSYVDTSIVTDTPAITGSFVMTPDVFTMSENFSAFLARNVDVSDTVIITEIPIVPLPLKGAAEVSALTDTGFFNIQDYFAADYTIQGDNQPYVSKQLTSF